jgi:hypothetical protein
VQCFDGGAPRRPSVAIRIGWLLTLVCIVAFGAHVEDLTAQIIMVGRFRVPQLLLSKNVHPEESSISNQSQASERGSSR